jgi:hypothetical protein
MPRKAKVEPARPAAVIVSPGPGDPRKVSRTVLRERLKTVENLLKVGYDEGEVARSCDEQWRIGPRKARRYVELVRQRWAREEERDRPFWKARLIRATQRQLMLLSARLQAVQERPDEVVTTTEGKRRTTVMKRGMSLGEVERERVRIQAQISKAHSFLADLTGAREPLKIEVGVAEANAIGGVLAELTPQRIAALREHQRQQGELAQQARVLLRLPGGTEVVERPTTVLRDPK